MKNVFLILVTLALVTFAQAGPFGLKNGMTVDEIIDAGFELDKKRYESITGRKLLPHIEQNNLKNVKPDGPEANHFIQCVTNTKHTNMIFNFRISKFTGLMNVECKVYNEKGKILSSGALEKLFQIYSEKLEKKYKSKPKKTKENFLGAFNKHSNNFYLEPPIDKIYRINIDTYETPIHLNNRIDSRYVEKNLSIVYFFLSNDLHWDILKEEEEAARKKAAAKKKAKQEEEIKNLLPNAEDL